MLSYSSLSEGFWGEAMLIACHILKQVPSRTNKETPYELWQKRKQNLNYLRVWVVGPRQDCPITRERNLVNEAINASL